MAVAAGTPTYTTDVGGDPTACQVAPNSGSVTLFVFVDVEGGLAEFDLSAPIPECYSGAVTDYVLHPYSGDPQVSAHITFTSCLSAGSELVLVRDISVDDVTTSPCCELVVTISNGLDCIGGSVSPRSATMLLAPDGVCDQVTVISNTLPLDGADELSTSTDMSYRYELPPQCPASPTSPQVLFYFGTDPGDLSLEMYSTVTTYPGGIGDAIFDPGELAYGTTYYWRAAVNYLEPALTPVMSFTTIEPPVSVRIGTWGRVKALYRSELPD